MGWIRDLSIILLAIETCIIALVPLALFGGLVYAFWWLQRRENLPAWLKLVQAYIALIQAYVELAMTTVVRPILKVYAALATVRGWLGALANLARGGSR
jgi:hypothetical protein